MSGRWLVARVEFSQLDKPRQQEVIEWLCRLGVEPANFRPVFVVTDGPGGYAAHFSELLRNEAGKPFTDFVRDEPATRPLTIPVSACSLPSCVSVPAGR